MQRAKMFTPVAITRPSRSHARLGSFALGNVRFFAVTLSDSVRHLQVDE
jgi:hypothetical protein